MKDYLMPFLKFIAEDKQLSINTQVSYKSDIEQFIAYLKTNDYKSVNDVKNNTLVYYIIYLRKNSKATSTISRNLASIRSYYSFLYSRKLVNNNPTTGLELPRLERKTPSVLSKEEVDLLLDQPNTSDIKGLRDKAMLELLYSTGIKVTELTALNISDLSKDLTTLRINKQDYIRTINIEEVSEYMDEYINRSRPKLIKNTTEKSLFLNVNGGRLTRQGFWKIVKKYRTDSCIKKDVTPITLRHSFAAHLNAN